jgi:putative transposase
MEIKEPTKKYNTNSHLVFSCYYHVIFCPKYRRKCLKDEIEVRLKEIFYSTSEKHKFEIIDLEIMSDHVHMIVSCDPSFGIMTCIHKLKGTSSNLLRKEFDHLNKMPTLWTRSCFVSTVGSVSLDVVKKYIENQKGK